MIISRRRFALALLPLAFTTACASSKRPTRVSVESKIETGYDKKIGSLVLLTPIAQPTGSPNIWPVIADSFKQRGIPCTLSPVDPLELNRGEKLSETIKQTQADHIVIIGNAAAKQQSRSTVNGTESKGITVYDAMLVSASTRKPVWRARIVVSYFKIHHPDDLSSEIANALLDRLSTDQLLSSP